MLNLYQSLLIFSACKRPPMKDCPGAKNAFYYWFYDEELTECFHGMLTVCDDSNEDKLVSPTGFKTEEDCYKACKGKKVFCD